ncbi:MAG: hypothetical protein QM811_31025 [Pirellulales bacterium]
MRRFVEIILLVCVGIGRVAFGFAAVEPPRLPGSTVDAATAKTATADAAPKTEPAQVVSEKKTPAAPPVFDFSNIEIPKFDPPQLSIGVIDMQALGRRHASYERATLRVARWALSESEELRRIGERIERTETIRDVFADQSARHILLNVDAKSLVLERDRQRAAIVPRMEKARNALNAELFLKTQAALKTVCADKKVGVVFRVDGDPVDGANPNQVLKAISKQVFGAAAEIDLTDAVLKELEGAEFRIDEAIFKQELPTDRPTR